MKICEFEWREVDHNRFSGHTNAILVRGRVWSKNEERRQVICTGDSNLGYFYSNVPGPLNDLIQETNKLVIMDLMDRNVIPKQWPDILLDTNNVDEYEYPFHFKLVKTVLVDPESRLPDADAARQSYVEMALYSNDHGSFNSRCDLELRTDHLRKVFNALDELI